MFSARPFFKSSVAHKADLQFANETIIHPAAEGLPFGGIGPSGSGYHSGKYGFDMFTHLRSSLDSPSWIEFLLGFRYPPYTAKKFATMNKTIMPRLPARPKGPPPPDADEKSGSSQLDIDFEFVFALYEWKEGFIYQVFSICIRACYVIFWRLL
ncbi:hypothetical protein MPER_06683 [Moniliophthora perniciosa FA553]|nr:hypothetical protein MPER_06683 [Moniliophthora perniciosa FA553]